MLLWTVSYMVVFSQNVTTNTNQTASLSSSVLFPVLDCLICCCFLKVHTPASWGCWPIVWLALGVVLRDEVAQLLDDGVDELLPVSICLPELGEDVVLPARLLHPGDGLWVGEQE